MTIRRVVVGLDGSHASQRALDWAAGMASDSGAELIAAHVLTYSTELLRDLSLDTMTTWRRELDLELKGAWTASLREAAVRHRCRLVEDDSVAGGLMKVADAENADLIVVGAQGRGTIAGRVLGTTSYKLAHRAVHPVVVVPPGWVASSRVPT
jgi:nucleotide-binding universal stress UspA family protein